MVDLANVTDELRRLPCATDVYLAVQALVTEAQQAMREESDANANFELEVRVGRLERGRFRNGVPLPALRQLESWMDQGEHWLAIEPWHVITSVEFDAVVGGAEERLRSEVHYPGLVAAGGVPRVKIERKERWAVTDLASHAAGDEPRPARREGPARSSLGLRVALNRELSVPPDGLPKTVMPRSVCIKHRKNYQYVPTGKARPAWCYSLTQRWRGATHRDAEIAQRTQSPQCEVELECVDPRYLLQADPLTMAWDVLGKSCQLLEFLDSGLADRTAYRLAVAEHRHRQ